jgi:hypothetical protein
MTMSIRGQGTAQIINLGYTHFRIFMVSLILTRCSIPQQNM